MAEWLPQTTGLSGDISTTALATDGRVGLVVGTLANEIATSPDGATWTLRASPFGGLGTPSISGIAWNGTTYCAIAQDGSTQLLWASTSPDGVTWSTAVQVSTYQFSSFPQLLFGNGIFIIAGQTAFSSNGTATSPDGVTWTDVVTTYGPLSSGVFDGTQFLFGCSAGGGVDLTSTPDGVTWTGYSGTGFSSAPPALAFNAAISGPLAGLYIAADSSGRSELSSTLNFSAATVTTTGLEGGTVSAFAFDGQPAGLLVGVGVTSGSTVTGVVTSDGVSWTPENLGGAAPGLAIGGVIYALGAFFAYGAAGTLSKRGNAPAFATTPVLLNDEGIGGGYFGGKLNLVEFVYMPDRAPFLAGATNLIINRYKQEPDDSRQRGVDYTFFVVPSETIQSVSLLGISAQGVDQTLTDPLVTPLVVTDIIVDPDGLKFAYTVSGGQDGIEYTVQFQTVTQVQTSTVEEIFSINFLIEDSFP
jgi:hypothetical protein